MKKNLCNGLNKIVSQAIDEMKEVHVVRVGLKTTISAGLKSPILVGLKKPWLIFLDMIFSMSRRIIMV